MGIAKGRGYGQGERGREKEEETYEEGSCEFNSFFLMVFGSHKCVGAFQGAKETEKDCKDGMASPIDTLPSSFYQMYISASPSFIDESIIPLTLSTDRGMVCF